MLKRAILGVVALCLLLGRGVSPTVAQAADKAQIQQAMAKGAGWIKSTMKNRGGGAKTFAYLALLKADEPHDSPVMKEAVAHVLERFKDGVYTPGSEQLYEAAVEINLLADLDGEKYRPQIQLIADYITSSQSPEGHWNYLGDKTEKKRTGGDISVTHYACLGLWTAARAGIQVDPQVWERVLNWMNRCHNADGGYAYNPGVKMSDQENGIDSGMNMTVNGVGIMCIAILNIDSSRLPGLEKKTGAKSPVANSEPKKTGGSLERVDLDTPPPSDSASGAEPKPQVKTSGRIPDATFNTLKNALNWVSVRFQPVNPVNHRAYYYYSLERMGALANVTKLNKRDWYDECAETLLTAQSADGSWSLSSSTSGADNDTCFVVLFLSRSTGKVLKRTPTATEPPVGGGLLSGGRGLPDNLKDLDANGNVKKKKPENSSLDDLLASLQSPDSVDLDAAQAEIVEKIQLGDKMELVKQKDKLITLIKQKDPAIRKTAIWAIGRTGDLSLARFAIQGLDDPDSGVMVESHMALCWTARKPSAFKLPIDPLEGLASDASPEQKKVAIDSWRRQALLLWGEWYLRTRPYAERGDEFETNLRNRMLELK